MTAIEIVILVIIALAIGIYSLWPFLKFTLATNDLFWTLPVSGNIKYIYWGETLVKIVAEVQGKKVDGFKLVPLAPGEVQKTNKIEWIGFPPFVRVKRFPIEIWEEMNFDAEGTPATEWVKDKGEREVDSLRALFTRPFLLTAVELGDRQTVDLVFVGNLEVVDAWKPVAGLKGKFMTKTSANVRAAIDDALKGVESMDKFLLADKGEDGEILKHLKDVNGTLNKALLEQTGLRLTGGTIPRWDPSDKNVREAMKAQFLAEKQREKELVDLDTYERVTQGKAEADAGRIERLAKARGAQVKETVRGLSRPKGNPDVLTRAAAELLMAEAQPNLTTRVDGGIPVAMPVGGSK